MATTTFNVHRLQTAQAGVKGFSRWPPLPRDCITSFCKSYYSNLSIQGSSIFKMAGKSKSVMGAVQPEEIKAESRNLKEHGINLKK